MREIIETEYTYPFGKTEQYRIYLLYNGEIDIYVDNKQVKHKDDEILTRIFIDAINMDSWKHSWHLNVYDFKNKDTRDKIKAILVEKQKKREAELKYLKEVEQLLMTQTK